LGSIHPQRNDGRFGDIGEAYNHRTIDGPAEVVMPKILVGIKKSALRAGAESANQPIRFVAIAGRTGEA